MRPQLAGQGFHLFLILDNCQPYGIPASAGMTQRIMPLNVRHSGEPRIKSGAGAGIQPWSFQKERTFHQWCLN
jgi:hypothetical protein